MKVGTFLCWLFGHKFLGRVDEYDEKLMSVWTTKKPIGFCSRCGEMRIVKD